MTNYSKSMLQIQVLSICFLCFVCCADKKNSQKSIPQKSKEKVTKMTKEEPKEVTATVNPEQLKKSRVLLSETDQAAIDEVEGIKLFKLHCSICHGFKGDMKINGAKDLTISKIPLEESVAQIYHGKGLMQPYKGILSDAEIIAVARYSETLRK